jgi:hypothetical protein
VLPDVVVDFVNWAKVCFYTLGYCIGSILGTEVGFHRFLCTCVLSSIFDNGAALTNIVLEIISIGSFRLVKWYCHRVCCENNWIGAGNRDLYVLAFSPYCAHAYDFNN